MTSDVYCDVCVGNRSTSTTRASGLSSASRRGRGRSEASHIREALQRYLASGSEPTDDPLERLIGLVDDDAGPDDVAEEHDHYLYGAPKERE